MATDPLAKGERRRSRCALPRSARPAPRLSPLDLHARMDAIRQLAASNGLGGARRARAPFGAAGASSRPSRRDAVLPRTCRRSARQPFADRTARQSSPRSPSACTNDTVTPFVHWRRNARLLAAARRPRLHALAQHQAQADRRLSQGNARSRPRLWPRRADRHARHPGTSSRPPIRGDRRGADRPGAVLHEPRLCRRHGRDGVAAVAERAPASRPRVDDATISITDAVERLRSARSWKRRACLPRCSTISTRRAASRCSSWRPASFASGSARGSPSRRWPTPSGSRSKRSRRSGTGLSRRSPSCSTGPRAAASSRPSRDVPVFRPFMLAHPLDETQGLARRLCGRMEMGRHPRPARPCRRRDAALQPHRRRHFGQLPRRRRGVPDAAACSTASCWCAATRSGRRRRARRRGGKLQRAPAAARTQERQRSKMLGELSRRSCGSTTSCSTATRTCASFPGTERRERLEALRPTLDPDRFDVSQLIEATSFEELEDLRLNARDVGDRRHHAQAPRQPLCRRAAAPACGTNGSAIR